MFGSSFRKLAVILVADFYVSISAYIKYTFSTSTLVLIIAGLHRRSVLVLGQITVYILYLYTMPASELSTGLRIVHLSVYHLFNKVPEVLLLLHQASPLNHLFGINETCLDFRVDSNSIRIPNYCVMRRDSTQPLHTGIALYIQ